MKTKFKLLCITLSFLCVFEIFTPFAQPVYAYPNDEKLVGYEKVGETDTLTLYYNDEEISIAVLDKESDFVWTSDVDLDRIEHAENLNDDIKTAIRSIFLITYTDLTKDADNVSTRSYLRLKTKVDSHPIDNGVRLIFKMEELNMHITLEVFLEDEFLKVRIPSDGVKESVGIGEELEERMEIINANIVEIRKDFNSIKKANIPEIKNLISKAETYLSRAETRVAQIKGVYGLASSAQGLYSATTSFRSIIKGSRDAKGLEDRLKKAQLDKKDAQKILDLTENLLDLSFEVMSNAAALKGVSVGGLVELHLLPYFGAGYTDEEGYVFYPDGSGGITYFRENPPPQNQFYSKDIYSEYNVDLNEHDLNKENGIKDVMLPVYGIKREDNAFVSFISEGEADSNVKFYPAGYNVDINRSSFGFVYRRSYKPITKSWSGFGYYLIERERLEQDREVTFAFLSGEDANYSGMANRYREYLVESGELQKSQSLNDVMPFGLDLLMGIKEERVLKDKFVKMTTFSQAVDIIEELKQAGINTIQINLLGWMKNGFHTYPPQYKIESKLGSKRDFKKLIDEVDKNGYTLYLQDNLIDAHRENGGFSIGNDVARDKSTRQISDKYRRRYIFSPVVALSRFRNKVLPFFQKFSVDGIALEKAGSFIYADYNTKYQVSRQETAQSWNEIVKTSKKELGSAASLGGNKYVLDNVDRLINIPNETTGYFITDESVPFYQMVVHGFIPYSSKPFNLFYDSDREKLKAIEYGCIPYYQLTYEDSENLIHTSYNQLFSSKFDDWKDEAIEVYKEFNDNLGDTVNKCIVGHEKVKEDVYKTIYENGITVYVNYSSKKQEVDGHNIQANDYLVVKNGG